MASQQGHGESSEGEYEDDAATSEGHWQNKQEASTLSSPALDGSLASTDMPKSSAPMLKRRRVTRACDECRKKKIKCDAKQPCTHCTVYSYDCTYDQPSNRKRNPAPHYVESLEHRLQRAEALLKTVLPNVNLDDPNIDRTTTQRDHNMTKQEPQALPSCQAKPWVPLQNNEERPSREKDSMLESMVSNTGSLDLDDEGNLDFHGHSSGRIFLCKMRSQLRDLMGKPEAIPLMNYADLQPGRQVSSPKVWENTSMDPSVPRTNELPPKRSALLLSGNALDDAGAIIRIVHQPSYYTMLHRIYDTPYEHFGDAEHKFLPLLYGVLALGALFARAEQTELQIDGHRIATERGYHWHGISRSLIDVTDCRDLTSLQVILYMILFLQSTARLSTCYSYTGIVLRSAIRMGMHRSVSNVFNPIETELRKRIFWIVRKLDIYVGALLGLPQMLSNDDIDQEMPLEIDDEYITTENIRPMPPGKVSLFTALNDHTRLVEILAKTVKYVYPIKGTESSGGKSSHSYVVSHANIREIEQDLQQWMEALPMEFRPSQEAPPEFMRIRHLLRMAYAHIQMVLYRPFLHYISQSNQARSIDKRSYACAAACVSVSRNIVHLTGEMKRRGLLVGSYWFYMYTTFFAIISLVFYILENPQSPKVGEILKEAHEGRDTLAGLAVRSLAADRCSTTLAELFEQLPSNLQETGNGPPQQNQQAPTYRTLEQQTSDNAKGLASGDNALSPSHSTGRKNIFSHPNQSQWQPSSLPPHDRQPRHQIVPSIDSDYRRKAPDPYSPLLPNDVGIRTPHTRSSSQLSDVNQSTYNLQSPITGQNIPDLSALMFPSADPFVYPNQPMTTLENRQPIKNEDSTHQNMYSLPSLTTTGTCNPYEDMGGQLYNLSPPILLPGPQSGYLQGTNSSMGMSNGMSTAPAPSMPLQTNHVGSWPRQQQQQQQQQPLDQLFGEDWGGWINQGYR